MSWAAVATAGAGLLSGAASSGSGGGGAPVAPVDFRPTFGAVAFGDKYIGSDAVNTGGKINTPGWVRVTPWVVAGLVALFVAALFLRSPKK